MSDRVVVVRGIGFNGLLTVAFIVLKLCHVIDWSWWWVLAPWWGTAVLALLVMGAVLLLWSCGIR